eukprot:gene8098-10104_t
MPEIYLLLLRQDTLEVAIEGDGSTEQPSHNKSSDSNGDEVALSGDEATLRGDDIPLSDDEVALSGDEVALSGDEVALRGDDIPLSDDEKQDHSGPDQLHHEDGKEESLEEITNDPFVDSMSEKEALASAEQDSSEMIQQLSAKSNSDVEEDIKQSHDEEDDNENQDECSDKITKSDGGFDHTPTVSVEKSTLFPSTTLSVETDKSTPNDVQEKETSSPKPSEDSSSKQSEPRKDSLKKKSEAMKGTLHISVSDPKKVGEGMSSYVVYTVHTKTDFDSFQPMNDITVEHRYSDFHNLFKNLVADHPGVIVPPPPPKDAINTGIGKFKTQTDEVSPFLERRTMGLRRFMRKIAEHPILRHDENVKLFLTTETKLPKQKTSALSSLAQKLASYVESEEWFAKTSDEVDVVEAQLKKLHSSVYSL